MIKIVSASRLPMTETPEPVFVLQDGKLYRTIYHPAGWSDRADYELKPDGMIYRTHHHQMGSSNLPDYKIGTDKKLYRTRHHPKGGSNDAEFELSDQ